MKVRFYPYPMLQLWLGLLIPNLSGDAQVVLQQHTLSSTSNQYQGNAIRLDYTLGELAAVTTLQNGTITLTQGLHQPDKFAVGFPELQPLSWAAQVYPNPFYQQINIAFQLEKPEQFYLRLFDLSGRCLYINRTERISPGTFIWTLVLPIISQGNYMLKIEGETGKGTYHYKLLHIEY